jgi:hypothetical protein
MLPGIKELNLLLNKNLNKILLDFVKEEVGIRASPNTRQREKWLVNNPNKDGKINNQRPKKYVDTAFTAYKRECKKATYRTIYAMAKEGLVPKTGKRKTDLQIDHIIPYRQGFDLNISPEIMGGNKNLRFILGEENRKKWDNYQSLAVVQHIIGSSILAEDAIKSAINDYKSKTNLS